MLDEIKQVNSNVDPPSPAEEVDESAVFETNKRLLDRIKRLETQLTTARNQRDELAELITPAVDWKLVADCDQQAVARMVTAGWKPIFMSSAPRPGVMGNVNGISPVVVTVMFERIVPDRPTPPRRLMVPEVVDDPEKTDFTEQDTEDLQTAARIVDVMDLPTMRLLPTHNRYDLNRIVKENAYYRVNAALSGSDAS